MEAEAEIVGGIRMEPGFIFGGLKLCHGFFCSSETEEDRAQVVLALPVGRVLLDPFRVFGELELLEASVRLFKLQGKLLIVRVTLGGLPPFFDPLFRGLDLKVSGKHSESVFGSGFEGRKSNSFGFIERIKIANSTEQLQQFGDSVRVCGICFIRLSSAFKRGGRGLSSARKSFLLLEFLLLVCVFDHLAETTFGSGSLGVSAFGHGSSRGQVLQFCIKVSV